MSRVHLHGVKSDGSWAPFRMADVFKGVFNSSINGAAGIAAWTPGTGKRIRIMGIIANGATAGTINFYDNTVGATQVLAVGITTNQSTVVDLGPHGLPLTAGNPLYVSGPAGLSNVNVYGVEETP